MIELNKKTQQDFLNREWVQRLLDADVDMRDAKYCICFNQTELDQDDTGKVPEKQVVCLRNDVPFGYTWYCPTYTVSELLYKLHEKQGIYTIFNNLRNNDIDNAPIIESLASLLIQCHEKDIGIEIKDTGDISVSSMADFKIKKSPNEGKVIAYYETETEYFSATGDDPIDAVEQLQFLLEEEGIEV